MSDITVTSAAPDKDLTTLDRVKQELDIRDTSDDPLLRNIITEVSSIIVSFTGREFAQETVTEKVPGHGSPVLIVSRVPIQSISEIRLNDDTVDASDYRIENKDAGTIRRVESVERVNSNWINTHDRRSVVEPYWNPSFPDKSYEVDYTGGYVLPSDNWSGTRDLPYDVERAAIETVKVYYMDRTRDSRIETIDIGDFYRARYNTVSLGQPVPLAARSLLMPYVRIR